MSGRPASLGRRFAESLAAKDDAALRALLSADVDFKALTPGRLWEGTGADSVLDAAFGHWFEPEDEIRDLLDVSDGEAVRDTERISYRVLVRNDDGDHEVEQQAYYRVDGNRIGFLRILCSGYRPRG